MNGVDDGHKVYPYNSLVFKSRRVTCACVRGSMVGAIKGNWWAGITAMIQTFRHPHTLHSAAGASTSLSEICSAGSPPSQ